MYYSTKIIVAITKSSQKNIAFSDKQGNHYYINLGLEHNINLDDLKAKVLNKSVTLHLPKIFDRKIISEHIAQIAVGDTIIFLEFNKTD